MGLNMDLAEERPDWMIPYGPVSRAEVALAVELEKLTQHITVLTLKVSLLEDALRRREDDGK